MENFKRVVMQWDGILAYVKGRKSHQFTTDTLGASIYFNSAGMPLYVADDTPFTDFESHMTEKWWHEYFYNKTETSFTTAINNFRDGTGGIIIDTLSNGIKTSSREYWLGNPYGIVNDSPMFSISELLLPDKYKWYTVTDAIT